MFKKTQYDELIKKFFFVHSKNGVYNKQVFYYRALLDHKFGK